YGAFLSSHLFTFFSSRRRHTRWPRDWSSDVCSSDLVCEMDRIGGNRVDMKSVPEFMSTRFPPIRSISHTRQCRLLRSSSLRVSEIGRASCRERVVVSSSVRFLQYKNQ